MCWEMKGLGAEVSRVAWWKIREGLTHRDSKIRSLDFNCDQKPLKGFELQVEIDRMPFLRR